MCSKQKQFPNGYKRLNNYGSTTINNVVGKYDPNKCEMQYELVRVQSSPYNPWYPIQEEMLVSAYEKEDPWAAERAKENALNMPPPKYVYPQQQSQQQHLILQQQSNKQPVVTPSQQNLFVNRLNGQQLGNGHVVLPSINQTPFRENVDNRFVNLRDSCPSCVQNNEDCCDKSIDVQSCFAPACSSMRDCRDYSNRAGKPQWCVVTAPII